MVRALLSGQWVGLPAFVGSIIAGVPLPPAAAEAADSARLVVPLIASSPAAAAVGANAILPWDVAHGRSATETTTVTIATDGTYVLIRFVAKQREPIVVTQKTNNVGAGLDDQVGVYLWPNGTNGYAYQFLATPTGTHFQSSTENTNYEPTWESHGTLGSGQFTVTMKIPLAAIRGARHGAWRVQFARLVHTTGEQQVWRFGSAQISPNDLAYAGFLEMPELSSTLRPHPRLALYGLGALASKDAGGSTSRSGGDLSVPITPTASVYATVHPDFSNVELDQQSISPTALQRYYSEVRPFFTQVASFYNASNCYNGPCVTELYTPAIPTPRRGYAIEGQQGRIGFASLDAVGDRRNDLASALDYTSENLKWTATVQRVAVTTPALVDDVTTAALSFSDLKHIQGYLKYGNDSNALALGKGGGQRYDAGATWNSKTFAVYGNLRKVTDGYGPADAYVAKPDIAGYGLYANKIWLFSGASWLQSVSLGGYFDRYHGRLYGLDQADNQLVFDALTKGAFDFNISSGSSYLRGSDRTFVPVSQNGAALTYHSGSAQQSGNFGNHGPSATPTTISYATGRYGNGRLDTWVRSTTMRASERGTLTLELDNTAQWGFRMVRITSSGLNALASHIRSRATPRSRSVCAAL